MNYYKIVYPVSLYLLMIVYFTLKRERLSAMSVIFYAAGLGALLVTLTKSLWFGAVGGLLVYAGVYAAVRKKGGTALHRRDADLHKADESETGERSTDEGQANGRRINAGKANGRKAKGRKAAVLAIVTVAVGIIMNETLLDNYLLMRLYSAIATGHSEQIRAGQIVISDGQNEELRVLDEREGTKRANDTRIEQTKVLLKKWAERPWTGFGYGSYAEEMRRGPADKPYLYEMLLPSLLMQIGGLGILGWIVYFVYLIRYVCKRAPGELPVVYLLAAIGLASQFNPFLLGSAAMSMILYALLAVQVQAERLDRAGEPS